MTGTVWPQVFPYKWEPEPGAHMRCLLIRPRGSSSSHQNIQRAASWAFSFHFGGFDLLSHVVAYPLPHQCLHEFLCGFNPWAENFIWRPYHEGPAQPAYPVMCSVPRGKTPLPVRWTEKVRKGAKHSAGNSWFLGSMVQSKWRALFL